MLASPLSTGGAGFAYEFQAAAVVLSKLLAGAHCLGLPVPVARVAMQQRSRGYLLDDVVVYGDLVEPCPWIEFQVKRSLRPTAGTPEFVEVIGQALRSLAGHTVEFDLGDALLGIIAAEPRNGLVELRELARCCSSHSRYTTFAEALLQERVLDKETRERFDDVCETVAAAIAQGAPSFGTAAETAHRVLSVLRVWPLPAGESDDVAAALDNLVDLGDAAGVTPLAVFSHLVTLAEGWGPSAGVVDAPMVRRQLRWRGLRFGRDRNEHRIVEQIEADAVARGPLLALELDADLENAERLLAAGDVSCTAEFARVADVLEGRGHLPHAAIVRRREAKARDTFGDVDAAARCRADLAWKHLELMQPWEAGFALHDGQIAGRGEELSAAAQRIVALAQAAVDAAKGYALDDLVAAFDAADDGDPFRERAAAHLCEQAVADEQPDLVLARRASLSSIAQQAAATSDSSLRRLSARIEMCLADVTGEWPPLLMRAHRIHDPLVIAWMHARYGRWAALNGDGATAQHHYLLAIERACAGNMYQEAADWLYAWRTVRFWYGDFGRDEQHALAQALRVHPAAQTNKLPGSQHTPESALRALHADKPNEALERIRRWIWQAVVRAELTYEVEAVTALGDLVRTKQLDVEAVECYVRAGDAKAARAATDAIADKPVDLSTELLRPLGASRAAAYRGITGCADLLTDDCAGIWVEAALGEIDGLTPEPRRAPLDPAAEAFGTLAALADTLTCSQAVQLITVTESLLDRPANRHLETDDASVQVMTELARHHPCVGDRSVRGLLHALLLNDRLADKVLGARDVLQANRQIVGDMLAEPAAQDHHQACLALVVADADGTPALHHARQRVDQLLAPGRTQPYIVTMSAEPRDAAILVRLLSPERRNEFARTMIERALNRSSSTASRRSDLVALTYIATHLDDDVRTALFTAAMEIARGEHDVEELELADQSPFSIAQIQMPPTNLGVDGLRCAAALASRVEQFAVVEQIAIELLGPSHPDRAWTIATILYDLPGEHSRLELRQLAVHPSVALRALAAARWPRNAGSLPLRTARALATDANQRVRREVALAVMAQHAEATAEPVQIIRQMLAGDVRRSIRKIVAPAEAAATCATALRRPEGEG